MLKKTTSNGTNPIVFSRLYQSNIQRIIQMKKKISTIFSVLLGLMLINGGLNKFLNYMPPPDNLPEAMMKDFAALMEISWLMPLIAVAEIIGGLLVIFTRTRALGALVLFPVMVGILLTHIVVDPGSIAIVVVMWAILLWIMYDNREKYYPLIRL